MTKLVGEDGTIQELNSKQTPPAPASNEGAPAPQVKMEPVRNEAEAPGESLEQRKARLREERARVGMSVPRLKMSVPELSGYHMHWVNDMNGRVQIALRAGYEFVVEEEVDRHDFSVAGDSTKAGNSDLGSQVSMVVGVNDAGEPMTAYLMKIREELWRLDQELLQEKNDEISRALKRGRIGADQAAAEDIAKTYVKTVEVSRRDSRIVRSANPSTDI